MNASTQSAIRLPLSGSLLSERATAIGSPVSDVPSRTDVLSPGELPSWPTRAKTVKLPRARETREELCDSRALWRACALFSAVGNLAVLATALWAVL
jgi:hypothetical protein